jgi:hypothetical protein
LVRNEINMEENLDKYLLSKREYNKAKKMTDEQLFKNDICPECLHKIIDGKCLLHGTKEQIKMFRW